MQDGAKRFGSRHVLALCTFFVQERYESLGQWIFIVYLVSIQASLKGLARTKELWDITITATILTNTSY